MTETFRPVPTMGRIVIYQDRAGTRRRPAIICGENPQENPFARVTLCVFDGARGETLYYPDVPCLDAPQVEGEVPHEWVWTWPERCPVRSSS